MNLHLSTLQPKRVRHELRMRELEVINVQRISKNFVSVTFTGPDLADFTSLSFDDHIKIIFTPADGEQIRRDYTPRAFDVERLELTIEFALHDGGYASDWAQQAAIGQRLVIGGPRGSMIVPTNYDWHILIGDPTALPAISRRVEELPAGAQVIVLAQVDDTDDIRKFDTTAHLDIQWLTASDELLLAVKLLTLPAGTGYIWCAGEANVMTEIKQILIKDKNYPSKDVSVASYWKKGFSDFHEHL